MDKNWTILSILSVINIVISIVLTWKLNFISKVKELKLSNYYKEQIDKTKELYSNLVEMHLATNALFATNPKSWGLSDLKLRIDKWNKSFIVSYLHYHKNRILFPDTLKTTLNNHFEELKKIRSILLAHKEQVNDEEHYASYYYQNFDEEIEYVKKTLESLFLKPEISELLQKAIIIRANIEVFFSNLVGEK